jgi:hypothetical protein
VIVSAKQLIGDYALERADGHKLNDMMKAALGLGSEVSVDFDGVRYFSGSFFSAMFSGLKPDDVTVFGLDPVGASTFRDFRRYSGG